MVSIDICVHRWDGLDGKHAKWAVDVSHIAHNPHRLVKDTVVYNPVILVDTEIKFLWTVSSADLEKKGKG